MECHSHLVSHSAEFSEDLFVRSLCSGRIGEAEMVALADRS
jgi:hypothetical protein